MTEFYKERATQVPLIPAGQFVHFCSETFLVDEDVVERALNACGIDSVPDDVNVRCGLFDLFVAYRDKLFRRIEPVVQLWEVERLVRDSEKDDWLWK